MTARERVGTAWRALRGRVVDVAEPIAEGRVVLVHPGWLAELQAAHDAKTARHDDRSPIMLEALTRKVSLMAGLPPDWALSRTSAELAMLDPLLEFAHQRQALGEVGPGKNELLPAGWIETADLLEVASALVAVSLANRARAAEWQEIGA